MNKPLVVHGYIPNVYLSKLVTGLKVIPHLYIMKAADIHKMTPYKCIPSMGDR